MTFIFFFLQALPAFDSGMLGCSHRKPTAEIASARGARLQHPSTADRAASIYCPANQRSVIGDFNCENEFLVSGFSVEVLVLV